MQIDKFKNAKPEFFLEDYFSGKVKAWGLFHDRFGTLKSTFEVDINGTLKNDLLILDEKFLYDDGEKEQTYNRSFSVGREFDLNKINFTYVNGVLEVDVPRRKKEEYIKTYTV